MKRNRKGISPVIATLLLIVISVAAAVMTYIWLTRYMGTLQSQAGTSQLQERVKIEGVKISEKDDKITKIYVRNIGDVEVTIDAVYLIDSSGNILYKDDATLPLSPTDDNVLTVELTGLVEGKTYTVKIVTTRGTEFTYTFTYRKK